MLNLRRRNETFTRKIKIQKKLYNQQCLVILIKTQENSGIERCNNAKTILIKAQENSGIEGCNNDKLILIKAQENTGIEIGSIRSYPANASRQ